MSVIFRYIFCMNVLVMDIYSFGVLLIEIFCMSVLFKDICGCLWISAV